MDVYFDDVTMTFTPSAVVQQDDFYPFGLTFNSYSRQNIVPQNYLYNEKESIADLGLNWDDYRDRMYMADIGRFTKIDDRAHNYMMYSPYEYVANNPANSTDVNGDFILPAQFREKYKRLSQYLERGVQGILGNQKIVNSLKKHGGFSDAQIREILTWDKGPVVSPTEILPLKFDDGTEVAVYGAYLGGPSLLINVDLLAELEQAQGRDRDYMLFLVAVTILHESVHYGYFRNGLTDEGEEGNDFERDAYGEIINKKSYKRIMDNWLNQQPKSIPSRQQNPGPGGGGGETIFLFPNSSSGNSSRSGLRKMASPYHHHKRKGKE